MNRKKKILLLTTGGTIASVPGGEGLEPHRSGVMERELEQLRTYYDISVRDVMCLDSSNIRPEEWKLIAREIFENREALAQCRLEPPAIVQLRQSLVEAGLPLSGKPMTVSELSEALCQLF